jgi:ABC-type branched-subunit amino acid transport system substrate-binding protein
MKKLTILAALATAVAVACAATLASASTRSHSTTRVAAAATAKVKCGKRRTIGVAYPATGDAASIGVFQIHWAKFAANRWNKTHRKKIRLVQGDTQLPNTAQALAVAHQFSSNKKMLAVTGPAGSQEVQDTIQVFKRGGLAAVSGSATRVALTRSKPGASRETPVGYFFRTVPNDGQQGDRVAFWIVKKLQEKRIYIIDDEEAYSQGLADQVQSTLKSAYRINAKRDHVAQSASDFSSLIARIPKKTQVVYIPWQLAGKAQTFYLQLRASGRSAIVFGSDGLFAPGTFEAKGGYVSAFPVDYSSPALKAFKRAHGGKDEAFGLPTYTSVLVNATAINKACKAGHGKTTRKAVRKRLQKVKLTAKQSLLGFPVHFLSTNAGAYQGPGDMSAPANFAIYHITSTGKYVRVG